MKGFDEKMCPQCGFHRTKKWKDLDGEEKLLAERLPLSAAYARRERETHRFCLRCWNEIVDDAPENC